MPRVGDSIPEAPVTETTLFVFILSLSPHLSFLAVLCSHTAGHRIAHGCVFTTLKSQFLTNREQKWSENLPCVHVFFISFLAKEPMVLIRFDVHLISICKFSQQQDNCIRFILSTCRSMFKSCKRVSALSLHLVHWNSD